MPDVAQKLDQLRPVTFRYKMDPKNVIQYGLIAEEVANVYPELVIRDDTGKIMGIHYEELAPMLLAEVKKQRAELSAQQAIMQSQSGSIDHLNRQVAELNDLSQELRSALRQLHNGDGRSARR